MLFQKIFFTILLNWSEVTSNLFVCLFFLILYYVTFMCMHLSDKFLDNGATCFMFMASVNLDPSPLLLCFCMFVECVQFYKPFLLLENVFYYSVVSVQSNIDA